MLKFAVSSHDTCETVPRSASHSSWVPVRRHTAHFDVGAKEKIHEIIATAIRLVVMRCIVRARRLGECIAWFLERICWIEV
jgi:hypothetical protein